MMRDALKAHIAAQHTIGRGANTLGLPEGSQLLILLDNLPDIIYLKDCDGNIVFGNAALLSSFGRNVTESIGADFSGMDFLAPKSAAMVREADMQVMRTGEGIVDFEEEIAFNSGALRWFSTTKVAVRDESGSIIGVAGISRDITERKRQETLARGHAALLEMIVTGQPLESILQSLVLLVESLLQGIKGSIFLYDAEIGCLHRGTAPNLPDAYKRLLEGIKVGPKVGSCGTAAFRREPVLVCDILSDPLWEDHVEMAMRYGFRSCWSTPIMGPGDSLLGTFALHSGTSHSPSALETELIEMATNIAGIAIDRRRSEERVHFMAHHDPLTGLPNRSLFWSQFSRSLHEARREGRMVAITYIDLDNFKQINDVHGHAAGDAILRAAASRIIDGIRASDIAVRLGGDEFAIVFSNPKHDEAGILRRLEAIRIAIAEPVEVDGEFVSTTCSIGAAFYPGDGDTPETLLASADKAMYEAKKMGRDRFKLFVHSGDGI
jgi:diguanylate cyclase (GGDEF)-like protein/PAS domain S-box-containing protein